MSLGSLARYDDAEDEIRDEDHNLQLKPPQAEVIVEDAEPSVVSQPPVKASPPSAEGGTKPKILVPYGGGFSDDEDTSSENESKEEEKVSKGKPAIINLGLYDGTSLLTSAETDSPKTIESYESSPRGDTGERTVLLPPEPPGRCSKILQEKIAKMIEKKKNGMNVNEYIQNKKAFRNPSIYDKLVTL